MSKFLVASTEIMPMNQDRISHNIFTLVPFFSVICIGFVIDVVVRAWFSRLPLYIFCHHSQQNFFPPDKVASLVSITFSDC